MPSLERLPISTTQVVAGWTNPTRCYIFNNSYANSTTNLAEQTYDYLPLLTGAEVIDKVFVKLEYYYLLTGVNLGDDATITFSIKVYDGSTWTTYQVSANTFALSTANDESFTHTIGDNSNSTIYIDVTSKLDTLAKLNSAQTRLLTALTADAGLTPNVYVDAISILAVYHSEVGIMPSRGAATTRRSRPRVKKALDSVEQYLTS